MLSLIRCCRLNHRLSRESMRITIHVACYDFNYHKRVDNRSPSLFVYKIWNWWKLFLVHFMEGRLIGSSVKNFFYEQFFFFFKLKRFLIFVTYTFYFNTFSFILSSSIISLMHCWLFALANFKFSLIFRSKKY